MVKGVGFSAEEDAFEGGEIIELMIDEDIEKAGGEPGDSDLEFGNQLPDIFDGEVGLGEDEGGPIE